MLVEDPLSHHKVINNTNAATIYLNCSQFCHFTLKNYNCYSLALKAPFEMAEMGDNHLRMLLIHDLHLSIHIIHSWKRLEGLSTESAAILLHLNFE